jgi:hypothetical protein
VARPTRGKESWARSGRVGRKQKRRPKKTLSGNLVRILILCVLWFPLNEPLVLETPKDPGIPNNFPFKDQVLAEVSEQRRIVCGLWIISDLQRQNFLPRLPRKNYARRRRGKRYGLRLRVEMQRRIQMRRGPRRSWKGPRWSLSS